MENRVKSSLQEIKVGLVLVLMTLFFGYALGPIFGVLENDIKSYIQQEAVKNLETAYNNDQAKLKKITLKSWTYIKRGHFHANGIGTTAIALTLFLLIIETSLLKKKIAVFLMGFGGLFYSLCWTIAGLNAPALGSTGAAKAQLVYLATPAATMATVGIFYSMFLIIQAAMKPEE